MKKVVLTIHPNEVYRVTEKEYKDLDRMGLVLWDLTDEVPVEDTPKEEPAEKKPAVKRVAKRKTSTQED